MSEETRIVMGMPVTVAIPGREAERLVDLVFSLFHEVDQRFSLYRPDSEISRFNKAQLASWELSSDMREVLAVAEQTRKESHGFFDVANPAGRCDPTGIVKGWAIKKAANFLNVREVQNYCINAGGDIQASGLNGEGKPWQIGISSPFRSGEVVKVLSPGGAGVATSGSYVRGHHVWNPHAHCRWQNDIVSITVIGRDILEADRFATAAFAMGKNGVYFIEGIPGLDAYQINAAGVATQTSSFEQYVVS